MLVVNELPSTGTEGQHAYLVPTQQMYMYTRGAWISYYTYTSIDTDTSIDFNRVQYVDYRTKYEDLVTEYELLKQDFDNYKQNARADLIADMQADEYERYMTEIKEQVVKDIQVEVYKRAREDCIQQFRESNSRI